MLGSECVARRARRDVVEGMLRQQHLHGDILQCVDLHGMHVNEAVAVADAIIAAIRDTRLHATGACPADGRAARPVARTVSFVTGVGSHSGTGPRLRPALAAHLRVAEAAPGVFRVTVRPGP